MKFIFILLLFVLLNSKALADHNIIVGKPYKMIAGTNEVVLSKKESEEYGLKIIEKENVLFWSTRENRILEKTNSGCYDTYTSEQGSGMIVIINDTCKQIICENEKLCFTYSEHIRSGLGFISYYGFIN